MSANYQQPAKHEKSAENPILARLGLELGKPHLFDWSSGPTFFWEENKLHLQFRFDCVVKKVQIDFCWFAAWYWKRIDWGWKWLDQRQLVGSKILGQRSQFGSFLQQKLGQFFSFHNGRLKRKVGMRCNVQNECKNLRAQKIIIFPFNQRCMYFCDFCLLSWICIHISIYVGFDLSLTAVENKQGGVYPCFKLQEKYPPASCWPCLLPRPASTDAVAVEITLPEKPPPAHLPTCQNQSHNIRSTYLFKEGKGAKFLKKNDRERLYLFIILTVSDWRSLEKM